MRACEIFMEEHCRRQMISCIFHVQAKLPELSMILTVQIFNLGTFLPLCCCPWTTDVLDVLEISVVFRQTAAVAAESPIPPPEALLSAQLVLAQVKQWHWQTPAIAPNCNVQRPTQSKRDRKKKKKIK